MSEVRRTQDDDWSVGLEGLTLFHELHLHTSDWSSWEAAAARITGAGARIDALALTREAAHYNVRCKVSGLSAGQARALAGALSEVGGATRVGVEHLMLAKTG